MRIVCEFPVATPLPSVPFENSYDLLPVRLSILIKISFCIPGCGITINDQYDVHCQAIIVITLSAFCVGHNLSRFCPTDRIKIILFLVGPQSVGKSAHCPSGQCLANFIVYSEGILLQFRMEVRYPFESFLVLVRHWAFGYFLNGNFLLLGCEPQQ